jgi:glycosyltransferase involved in cell wall biosynthesis
MIFSIHTDQHIKDANGIFGYAYGYNNIVKHFNQFTYYGKQMQVVDNDPSAQVQMFYMEPEWHHPTSGHDFRQPGFKKHHDHQYKINGTYLEATKAWEWWIPTMKTFDEIWVGNQFSADAVANSGVDTPTYVFELGVDDMWTPFKRGNRGKIKFLHVDSDSPRKRADLVEAAFLKLFKGNDDVELTLKHHGSGDSAGYSVMELFNRNNESNINRIFKTLTQQEMVQLYHDHDILVYPTEGEGFGLIPLQALATGMPTISTSRWCSYEKYLGSNIIESTLGKTQHSGYHTGDVILPDFDSTVELMKNAVDNFDTQCDYYYKQAPKVIKEYSWQSQCDKMLKSLIKRVGISMFEPIEGIVRDKYIYLQSGAGYSTGNGVKFSREKPIQKVSDDEYNSLIINSNFRKPTDQEITKYLGGYNG